MTTRWSLSPCALASPSTLFASPPNPRQGCWPSVDVHVRCNSVKCCKIRELDMSDEKEVMSRRRVLSLLGLAGLSLAVPTVLTVSDATISDAEAQAAPPAAPAAGPTTGTERRKEHGAAPGSAHTPHGAASGATPRSQGATYGAARRPRGAT